MDLKETKLSSEPIYQGSFVTINRDKVRLPNGNESQRIVIRHPGAACVLAVTEEGKAVLVRQWRYAADAATLELPAGKLDAGEDPAECALRELAEETPYTADRVKLISSFYTAIGFCDEKMYLYQAEGVHLEQRRRRNHRNRPDEQGRSPHRFGTQRNQRRQNLNRAAILADAGLM